VLQVVNDRSSQLDTTIVTLQQLVSGLAEDRKTIGSTLDGLGDLTTSVADLLDDGREPLKGSITALDQLAGNLSDAEPQLDSFFEQLPTKLDRIGRTGSYGSWINFYACSIEGKIPRPEGYYGDLGAKPVAERCR
jgi:phospholipid/cholesterol/gamma-HCH transport system substrate-binding protein